MQVFVWKLPSIYAGFAVGYTKERFLCVMAKNHEEAIKVIHEQVESTPSYQVKEQILKAIQDGPLMAYNEGDVFSLNG